MPKKFNQIWVNQTKLAKEFELSAINIGKILIEHELKDPKNGQATSKAIQEGYAKSTPLKNGSSFFMWHHQKTKNLISKKHEPLNIIDFWVNEVKDCLLEIENLMKEGQDKMASLISDHIYEEVPKNLREKVKAKIEALTI